MNNAPTSPISRKMYDQYRKAKTLYNSEPDCDIPGFRCVEEEYVPGNDMEADRLRLQRVWVNSKDEAPYVVVDWRQCPNGSWETKVKFTEVEESNE